MSSESGEPQQRPRAPAELGEPRLQPHAEPSDDVWPELEATMPHEMQHTMRLLRLALSSSSDRAADQRSAKLTFPQDDGAPISVGRFQLLRKVGEGTFAAVYEAEDHLLERSVALKLPKAAVMFRQDLRERFIREARAASRLQHPNIVQVLDANAVDGELFIAMEFCDGPTLQQWLRDRPAGVDCDTATRILHALSAAVDHAHQKGIIHRDIKPANILLQPRPAESTSSLPFEPRLTDFGLAKIQSEAHLESTVAGAVLGTMRYMSPEQVGGNSHRVDASTDIYALGVVLYELLTGRIPHTAVTPADLMAEIRHAAPVPVRRFQRRIPVDLEAICMKCLEKSPHDRYRSVGELHADLQRFMQLRPVLAHRAGPAKRCLRWAQRRPAHATAVFITLLSVLLIGGVLVERNGRLRHSNRALDAALFRSQQAEHRARASDERSRKMAYASDMRLAAAADASGDLIQLADLLADQIPRDDHRDLRGVEWHLLAKPLQIPCRRLEDHQGDVNGVQFSGDGQWLASCGDDGTIRIYDSQTLEARRTMRVEHEGVNRIAFSPDDTLLASSSEDGAIGIWQVETGRRLLDFMAHDGETNSVLFSPDGDSLYSAGDDGLVRKWNAYTGSLEREWQAHSARVERLTLSPDGRHLASAGRDRRVVIWDIETEEISERFEAHPIRRCTDACFLGAGDAIAVGVVGVGVHFVSRADIPNGSWLKQHDTPEAIATSPDGKWGLAGDWAGNVAVWPIEWNASASGSRIKVPNAQVWQAHDNRVWSIAFSPDGQQLATASRDGSVRIWQFEDVTTIPFRRLRHSLGAMILDRNRFVSVEVRRRQVRLQELASGREIAAAAIADRELFLPTVAASPDRRFLAISGLNGPLVLYEATSLQELARVDGQIPGSVVALEFIGDTLLAVSTRETTEFLEVPSLRRRPMALLPERLCNSLACSHHGRWLALGLRNTDIIEIWDLERGKLAVSLTSSPGGQISALEFSADDRWLVSGDASRQIKLWDWRAGRLEHAFSGHRGTIQDLAFYPDGERLFSVDDQDMLKIWHLPTRRELVNLRRPREVTAPHGTISISPDGRFIVVQSTCNEAVDLYDVGRAAVAGP